MPAIFSRVAVCPGQPFIYYFLFRTNCRSLQKKANTKIGKETVDTPPRKKRKRKPGIVTETTLNETTGRGKLSANDFVFVSILCLSVFGILLLSWFLQQICFSSCSLDLSCPRHVRDSELRRGHSQKIARVGGAGSNTREGLCLSAHLSLPPGRNVVQ